MSSLKIFCKNYELPEIEPLDISMVGGDKPIQFWATPGTVTWKRLAYLSIHTNLKPQEIIRRLVSAAFQDFTNG